MAFVGVRSTTGIWLHGRACSWRCRLGWFRFTVSTLVRTPAGEVVGVAVLGMQRVGGDDRTDYVDAVQQRHEGGDLVGLVIHLSAPSGSTGIDCRLVEDGPTWSTTSRIGEDEQADTAVAPVIV
jgi:hypothetical protein